MPEWIRAYVRFVDKMNRYVGRFAMYLVFVMMAVLFYSTLSSNMPGMRPSVWTLETAQFVMVAFYLLGGAYSMQLGGHVRMDLVYGMWSDKTKAVVDCFTVFFLLFYLVVLLWGGISSTTYAVEYGERSYSAWRPYMWPIKMIACFGIVLMILQTVAQFFKDLAKVRGEELV